MSGTARRYNAVVPDFAITEKKPGVRIDPGPHIGVVKANIDPLRKGRLSVFIESFGGDPYDETNWRVVQYSSPFFGQTPNTEFSGKARNNDWVNTTHSYGMWFTPPDLETRVICMFINGDPDNGYYMGCIPQGHSQHPVPGHATSSTARSDDKDSYNADTMPVSDYNERVEELKHQNFKTNPKPANPILVGLLKFQGLFRDAVRGLTTSSAKRESPSRVFGISTPGRPYPEYTDEQLANLSTNEAASQKQTNLRMFRFPGHQFVMDDGDKQGNSNLVRLRTAGGHQVLMHDTAGVVYIASGTGNAWMEFRNDGRIDVYSKESISYHAEKDFNVTAGQSINFHSKGPVNMVGEDAVYVEGKALNIKGKNAVNLSGGTTTNIKAGGILSLSGTANTSISSALVTIKGALTMINSGGAVPASTVPTAPKFTHPAVKKQDTEWVQSGSIESIATRVPMHEPWNRNIQFAPIKTGSGNGIGLGTVLSVAGAGLTALGATPDTFSFSNLADKTGLSTAFGGVTGPISEAWSSVKDSVGGIADSLTEAFGTTTAEVTQWFNETKAEITDTLNDFDFSDPAGEINNKINGELVTLAEDVFGDTIANEFGEDIVTSQLVSQLAGAYVTPLVTQRITDSGIEQISAIVGSVNNVVQQLTLEDVATFTLQIVDIPYLTVDNAKALVATVGTLEKAADDVGSYDWDNIRLDGTVEIGKYSFDLNNLQDLGYVKAGTNLDLNDPDVWTGKDGIIDKSKFLLSEEIQDSSINQLLTSNIEQLESAGAIKPEDDQATVAGMAAVAKRAGVDNAIKWRNGEIQNDTYDEYFAQANGIIKNQENTGVSNIVNSSTYDAEYAARVSAERDQNS